MELQVHEPPHASTAPDPAHRVQFYERDAFLARAVGNYLAEGVAAGEPLLVIATGPHCTDFSRQLRLRGLDVDALRATDALEFIDAHDLLSRFMRDGVPDPARFSAAVTPLLNRPRAHPRSIRAYGEMVDILCRDGNADAAVRIEQFWNELARTWHFTLLCGYQLDSFGREDHGDSFDRVCEQHSHAVPAERYYHAADEESRLREICRLQQRAGALSAELEHRKVLETALRDALSARQIAEAETARLLAAEQAARADAEKADRLKDEFLAVLSHELRTPLNAILGWLQIITTSRRDFGTVAHALEVIQRNAQLQLNLINDLLDVSRIMAGKLQVCRGPVDVVAIVAAAVESIRPAAAAKNIEIHVQVVDGACFTTGDSDRLQQVMWNLLSNAVKFTPKSGRITVSVQRIGRMAEIVVRDTGQGITPEFLPHVFDRFSQEHGGTTRGHGGLGLGLAVGRHLVEAHGGTLVACSDGPGRGSVFTVQLPLREVTPAERAQIAASVRAGASPERTTRVAVLAAGAGQGTVNDAL